MQIQTKYTKQEFLGSLEYANKVFSQVPQETTPPQLTDPQKVEKYNCLRAFQMCLESGFDDKSKETLANYL
jgi:hypothetical protein